MSKGLQIVKETEILRRGTVKVILLLNRSRW
jgi:hypothetical protein